MIAEDQRRLVESFVVTGLHPDEEMEATAERLGTRGFVDLTTAALTEAVDRKYGDDAPTPEDLRDYARYLGTRYGDAEEPAKPLIAEALIRAHFGETDLLKGLSIDDVIKHQILIAYDVFASLNLDQAGLDEFVNDVFAIIEDGSRD